ncbi:hypothetical protein N9D31_00100 [Oligoflexaceae bacterium]|nr:hypothetical protein [Oligoflexaceae bacterium]
MVRQQTAINTRQKKESVQIPQVAKKPIRICEEILVHALDFD